MELEHPFMRAPYEAWSKFVRNSQKMMEQELKVVTAEAKKMAPKKAATPKDSAEQTAKQLAAFANKVQGLKRKLEEMEKQSIKYLQRSKTRLEHVQCIDASSKPGPDAVPSAVRSALAKVRMDRLMVDHLLREGHYNTANALATESDIKELVDLELFVSAKNVIDSLTAHDCSKALAWCVANRSKLKRINSPLEFELHVQEFIELVRGKDTMGAVKYAQAHLAPLSKDHMPQIQEVMGTLAFAHLPSSCVKYSKYFSNERWTELITLFRSAQFSLNGVPQHSLLDISLQAGLSALKTPSCGTAEHSNPNCPICSEPIASLAENLPYSQRVHSRIVCRITGEVMDEHNPPLCLPNGNVYSRNALIAMSKEHPAGRVTCPRTGQSFILSECKNVFIL